MTAEQSLAHPWLSHCSSDLGGRDLKDSQQTLKKFIAHRKLRCATRAVLAVTKFAHLRRMVTSSLTHVAIAGTGAGAESRAESGASTVSSTDSAQLSENVTGTDGSKASEIDSVFTLGAIHTGIRTPYCLTTASLLTHYCLFFHAGSSL